LSSGVFGAGIWLPPRVIVKRRTARGHNHWGWLQPSKSYEFVPMSAPYHPSTVPSEMRDITAILGKVKNQEKGASEWGERSGKLTLMIAAPQALDGLFDRATETSPATLLLLQYLELFASRKSDNYSLSPGEQYRFLKNPSVIQSSHFPLPPPKFNIFLVPFQ